MENRSSIKAGMAKIDKFGIINKCGDGYTKIDSAQIKSDFDQALKDNMI